MIKEIKKLEFETVFEYRTKTGVTTLSDAFNNWWDHNIEPVNEMLKGAVEVRTIKYSDDDPSLAECTWAKEKYWHYSDTHRAYLIGVEPIKQETREEKLEKILRQLISEINYIPGRAHPIDILVGDAKRALGE